MDKKNNDTVAFLIELWKFYVWLFKALIGHKASTQKTASIRRSSYGPTVKTNRRLHTAKKAVDVKANPLPYHEEQKWQRNAGVHRGYYRCRLGSFRGEVEKRPDGGYKFYILDPPKEILVGSHKACFTTNGNNRYHIHFGINSNNLDGGIMAVERLLSQSLTRR